jgi:hypothetical protein
LFSTVRTPSVVHRRDLRFVEPASAPLVAL